MTDRDYYTEEEQDASSEARYRNKEKRVGYVPVSNALIRLFSDLPDAALRTYLALCSYAFGRGETFVGQETLCQIRGGPSLDHHQAYQRPEGCWSRRS